MHCDQLVCVCQRRRGRSDRRATATRNLVDCPATSKSGTGCVQGGEVIDALRELCAWQALVCIVLASDGRRIIGIPRIFRTRGVRARVSASVPQWGEAVPAKINAACLWLTSHVVHTSAPVGLGVCDYGRGVLVNLCAERRTATELSRGRCRT